MIPKTHLSISEVDNSVNTHNPVLQICCNILHIHTGRHLTADRRFTSIETAEKLYEKDVTYSLNDNYDKCFDIMKHCIFIARYLYS